MACDFTFACSKESNQRKEHPLPLFSCAALKSWALRNSPLQATQNVACRGAQTGPRLKPPNFLNHHRRGSRGIKVNTILSSAAGIFKFNAYVMKRQLEFRQILSIV